MLVVTLFVLDFRLDIFDSVAGFNLESDGFPRQGFHEDLHVDFISYSTAE